MKKLTAEDYIRIRREAQAVRDRALSRAGGPICTPTTTKRSSAGSTGSARSRTPTSPGTPRRSSPRPPKYSREKISALYRDGMRVGEIARVLGAHRGTIHRALIESGAYDPSRAVGGPVRRTHCSHGHDLSEHGIELKAGGRDCRLCKRRRDRENAKRRYWAAKEQAQEAA